MRPLGVSVLTETSYLSSFAAAINLGTVEKEFYWATNDSKLLIEYLSLVKTTVLSSLHLFTRQVTEDPMQARLYADLCLRQASRDSSQQKTLLKLAYMLETASPDIQD